MKLMGELLLALWAGLLVSIGALVAPTLFAILANRVVAGGLASELFRRTTFVSIAVALVLCALDRGRGTGAARWRRLAPLVPAALLALGEFAVKPVLEAARVASGPAGRAFIAWHAVSGTLFAVATLLVVALLVIELKRQPDA